MAQAPWKQHGFIEQSFIFCSRVLKTMKEGMKTSSSLTSHPIDPPCLVHKISNLSR